MKTSSRSQSQKTAPKCQKNRLTEVQLRLLEATFNQEKKLGQERKFQLAYQLGLPARQVAIWYQNRRARWKTQNIELDYQTIQTTLERTLADKERLQNEVGRLRTELQRVQEMLFRLKYNTPPPLSSSLSSFCEDYSSNSSSMPADVNCHRLNSESWQTTESWHVEDLYSCLLGTGEQTSMLNNSSIFFDP
ncbi:hypothetical protein ACHQM5_003329 [Ranunculus cassubicifolius]